MNWYKIATTTDSHLSSSDGRQKGWEDQMGDIQRYSYDPYQVRVYITRLAESKITVSITLHHVWAGSIIWQDFWAFGPKEMSKATATYHEVKKAADGVFKDFRTNEIPNTLINSFLREAVRFIDMEHKPASRVPYVDWAREQKGVADWRSSIYGTRYPNPQGY